MNHDQPPERPVDPPEEYTRRDELFDNLNMQLSATKACFEDVLPYCDDIYKHGMVVRVFELLADLSGELE